MVVHRIAPLGAPVHATVRVPGSKSIANRALVCAALADGTSVLTGLPGGDDTIAMIEGLIGVLYPAVLLARLVSRDESDAARSGR